jgi:hypothetical protein
MMHLIGHNGSPRIALEGGIGMSSSPTTSAVMESGLIHRLGLAERE